MQDEQTVPDRPLRYLAGAACILAALLAAVAAFSYYAKWHSPFTQAHALVALQHGKLDSPAALDTVFVGDSSLAFSLYAPLFNQATGRHTVNAALNGLFGLAGTYNMARYAIARHPELRNIVVVQTSDVFTKSTRYHGYVLSAPDADLSPLDLRTQVHIAAAFVHELLDAKAVRQLGKYMSGIPVMILEDGYPRVRATRPKLDETGIQISQIRPESVYFLREVRALCRTRNLRCIFAFGPLLDRKFENSRAFLRRADAMVRESGFVLADPNPIPVARKNLANVDDHVTRPYKRVTTLHYAKLLAPLLK